MINMYYLVLNEEKDIIHIFEYNADQDSYTCGCGKFTWKEVEDEKSNLIEILPIGNIRLINKKKTRSYCAKYQDTDLSINNRYLTIHNFCGVCVGSLYGTED